MNFGFIRCRQVSIAKRVRTYLVRCAVNFAAACAQLGVIFIDVHYGGFGAFPHQVSSHARNVFETVSWGTEFHTLSHCNHGTYQGITLCAKKHDYFWISLIQYISLN